MKFRRIFRCSSAVLICLFVLGVQMGEAQQAPIKIGYIDLEKINDSWNKYRQAADQVKEFISSKRKELIDQKNELMSEYESFRLKQELLPAEDAKVRQQELSLEAKNLRDKETEDARSVEEKRKELLNPLMQELESAVEQVAKDGNFTFVFERRMLFYFSKDPNLDITARVLVLLNR
ncbi:MAG: OmpH family outer membrane protein [Candidatus Omnitrophica bacterium]|nr:OmpH family outer membrane protein [Candidatus Omnitrophota bacterium]